MNPRTALIALLALAVLAGAGHAIAAGGKAPKPRVAVVTKTQVEALRGPAIVARVRVGSPTRVRVGGKLVLRGSDTVRSKLATKKVRFKRAGKRRVRFRLGPRKVEMLAVAIEACARVRVVLKARSARGGDTARLRRAAPLRRHPSCG